MDQNIFACTHAGDIGEGHRVLHVILAKTLSKTVINEHSSRIFILLKLIRSNRIVGTVCLFLLE